MSLLIGIDDTDMPGTRGTNQLAREIVRRLASDWTCLWIVRHQLFVDPRVPYTSQNGSASIAVAGPLDVPRIADVCRQAIHDWFIPGSDPGLCVAASADVSADVVAYAHHCEREVVSQEQAHDVAGRTGLHLEGLGGTHGGVIGALAAVGLAREANSGRIVQWRDWPDDLSGPQPIGTLARREVEVRLEVDNTVVPDGMVDVGKHLRPNLRHRSAVLFVRPVPHDDRSYDALKLL